MGTTLQNLFYKNDATTTISNNYAIPVQNFPSYITTTTPEIKFEKLEDKIKTLGEKITPSYITTTTPEIKFEELEDKIKTLEEKIITKEKENKDMKEEKFFAYDKDLDIVAPYITKVEILNPDKVMRFTFGDDDIVKTVCIQDDVFDFEFAFYLAYAKHFFRDILNTNGIEKKAKELKDMKFFNYLVKKAMKTYFNQKKEEEKVEREKKERKEIEARQAAKKAAKKARARKARIAEMAEAFKASKSE